MTARLLKVIACEIAFREICHLAARSPNLIDLEFLPQGLHDTPCAGCVELQRRIDAVPPGRYDAILIGYGLCGNIIRGLKSHHTRLVIPRAHDCITFFLGSKERYQKRSETGVGTYYYTSGWLECLRRRGERPAPADMQFLPTRAVSNAAETEAIFNQWVQKYGEDSARYLLQTMDEWTQHYTHGALIDFEFTKPLELDRQVKQICTQRHWEYEEVPGDLGLLRRWLDGNWSDEDFLIVRPAEEVAPSYDERILRSQIPTPTPPPSPQKLNSTCQT